MHSIIGEALNPTETLYLYDPNISPGIRRYQEELFTALCAQGYIPTLGYFEKNLFTEQAKFSYRLPLPNAFVRNRMFLTLCKLFALDLFIPKKFKVIFVPSQHAPIVRFLRKGRKLVVTVHDIMPLIFGGLIKQTYYKFLLPRLISCADAVIACSRHTREDLIKRFSSLNLDKIHTIPHGSRDDVSPDSPHTQLEREKIILAIYRNEPWKNSGLLISAFQAADLPGYRLVNVGHVPTAKVLDDRIQFIGKVSDQELDRLYRSATCFVYPSLYEGFGLPILEAQARGCPVITSNRGVMRETAGISAHLFDPTKVDSLTKALQEVVRSTEIQDILRKRGFANVARYSWDIAAKRYMAIFAALYREISED